MFFNRHTLAADQTFHNYKTSPSRQTPSKYNPTNLFPIFVPQNPWNDEFHVVQERRATDFKAPKSEIVGKSHRFHGTVFWNSYHTVLYPRILRLGNWDIERPGEISTSYFFTGWPYFIHCYQFLTLFGSACKCHAVWKSAFMTCFQ